MPLKFLFIFYFIFLVQYFTITQPQYNCSRERLICLIQNGAVTSFEQSGLNLRNTRRGRREKFKQSVSYRLLVLCHRNLIKNMKMFVVFKILVIKNVFNVISVSHYRMSSSVSVWPYSLQRAADFLLERLTSEKGMELNSQIGCMTDWSLLWYVTSHFLSIVNGCQTIHAQLSIDYEQALFVPLSACTQKRQLFLVGD